MKDSTYRLAARLLKLTLWRGRLIGRENLPRSGPAVFVANHLDALGPIACVSEIPLRLYPWIHWKMLSEQESAEFLRVDFVEKTLRLRPPLSRTVSVRLSQVVLPLLRSIGCIPVHRGLEFSRKHITWKASLERLLAGQCLLVFPEDPDFPPDPATGVRKFMHGVLWLADVYYRAAGQSLPYYLAAVHPSRRMMVRPPLLLSPVNFTAERNKAFWAGLMEQTIIEMLHELSAQDNPGENHEQYTPEPSAR